LAQLFYFTILQKIKKSIYYYQFFPRIIIFNNMEKTGAGVCAGQKVIMDGLIPAVENGSAGLIRGDTAWTAEF
jgi:hypothetical protein